MSLEIIYEDNHLIVVNKKPSEIVQGDKTGDETLPDKIKVYLKEKYKKPGNVFCGVVHRLDRPTSGTVIFARTSKALERLNKQFHDKETTKIYWAIVERKPPLTQGTLVHFLKKNEKQNKSFAFDTEQPNSKRAILHYKLRAASDRYFLLEIELETGRHHQIRCQLSSIGCPIKGDLKYGAKRPNKDGSIALHAYSLKLSHPTTKQEMVFVSEPPKERLWDYFRRYVEDKKDQKSNLM